MPRPSPEFIYNAPCQKKEYWWRKNDGVLADNLTLLDPILNGRYFYKRTYSSTTTVGYRDLLKKYGSKKIKYFLPVNPHTVNVERNWDTGGYLVNGTKYGFAPTGGYEVLEISNTYYSSAMFAVNPPVKESPLGEARSRALSRLTGKIRANVNLGQMMAERGQTAKLLVESAERLVRGARYLRTGRVGMAMREFLSAKPHNPNAARVLEFSKKRYQMTGTSYNTVSTKDFSKLWLEYKYGWMPLVMDMHDAAELLAERIAEYDQVTWLRATAKAYEKTQVQPSSINGLGWGTVESETIYKFVIGYTVEDQLKSALAQTGISNPASLAWELLPYSFVVDWFIPVGNYLESLTAFDGLKIVTGTESFLHKSVANQSYSITHKGDGVPYWVTRYSGRRLREKFTYDRKVLTSFPSQDFPEMRNPLGGNYLDRMATATSLLRVLFKR